MARQPKKTADKRTESIRIMLTGSEKSRIEQAAAVRGFDVSVWLRSLALELIRNQK